MGTESSRAYVDVVRALGAAGVELVVIGSFGLELFLGEDLGHEPSDCDVLLRDARRDLDLAARALEARGWDVRVWDAPLARRPDGSLDADTLVGKTYARARRDALQLDLAYEAPRPGFDWARVAFARADISGVPVAAIETLLAMSESSPRPKDRALAETARAGLARHLARPMSWAPR